MMAAILLSIIHLFIFIHFISTTQYTCNSTVSCGCSALSTIVTSRIVGGEAASNYTWGWIVSLRKNGSHACGASLLTSEYAITAAHCVKNVLNNPSMLSIVVGTNYLNDISSTTIQQRTVQKIISHPNYNTRMVTNDIALLQFSPLTISSNSKLAFICLPNANEDPFQINSDLVAIGWGVTSESSKTVSNYLQQVTIKALSSTSTNCLKSGLSNSSVQFCAGISTGGKDTCQGDSGGPIMAFVNHRWILAGLTSFGNGCARADYPGVYTRISAFISFIMSNINLSGTGTISMSTTTTTTSNSNQGNILHKSIVIFIFSISFWFLFFVNNN